MNYLIGAAIGPLIFWSLVWAVGRYLDAKRRRDDARMRATLNPLLSDDEARRLLETLSEERRELLIKLRRKHGRGV